MFDFEDFPVYKKALQSYSQVLKILSNLKIDKSIRDQLRRASLSIVLNIAEGAGKYSKNDKKNFYLIARGSTNESVAIIRIIKIEGEIVDELYNSLYSDYLEIAKMLTMLIKAMLK